MRGYGSRGWTKTASSSSNPASLPIPSMAWSSSDWRMAEASSSPGAGGAERSVVGRPARCPSLGPEVAGVLVLEVGDGCGSPAGDVAQRGDEAVDVGGTGGQAGAGP